MDEDQPDVSRRLLMGAMAKGLMAGAAAARGQGGDTRRSPVVGGPPPNPVTEYPRPPFPA
jgi:hypothetical protein